MQKAKEIDKVRIVCCEINVGSNKTLLSNGGVYVDLIHGEESGMLLYSKECNRSFTDYTPVLFYYIFKIKQYAVI